MELNEFHLLCDMFRITVHQQCTRLQTISDKNSLKISNLLNETLKKLQQIGNSFELCQLLYKPSFFTVLEITPLRNSSFGMLLGDSGVV